LTGKLVVARMVSPIHRINLTKWVTGWLLAVNICINGTFGELIYVFVVGCAERIPIT